LGTSSSTLRRNSIAAVVGSSIVNLPVNFRSAVENGYFARAEQFDVLAANNGKTRPYKMYAMGDLRVYSDNTPSGIVEWGWHVVPVVRNRDKGNIVIVFDPALSPCRPLPYKEWLALMANLTDYTNPANGYGVAVGDSNSYTPWSLVTGEASHAAESLNDEIQRFLPAEWDRQVEMGREPYTVLGTTPSWSGYNCVSVRQAFAYTTVAAGATATLTASCPYATLAIGGGYNLGSSNFDVSKDAMSGNGWQSLQGTNLSLAQTTSSGLDSSGFASASCSSPTNILSGGGWVFPRTTAYKTQQADGYKGIVFLLGLTPAPANGDANAKAYAQCLGHP
jgi:hypothetical protein